ncbi:unnamed protein product, partial [Amoebophrya sp. A120]|eukprot:GSA120T00010429001.1
MSYDSSNSSNGTRPRGNMRAMHRESYEDIFTSSSEREEDVGGAKQDDESDFDVSSDEPLTEDD